MFLCCAPPEDKQPQITITAQEVRGVDVKPASVTAPVPTSDKIAEEKPPPVVSAPVPSEPEQAPAPEPAPAPAPAAVAAPEPVGPVKVNKHDPFDVVLDKSGGKKMGLALNQQAGPGGKNLGITTIVAGGLASEHNAKAAYNQHILPGSFILAVDGAEGAPADMVKAMGASPKTTLKIQPPHTKDVTITKNGAGLGLGMKPAQTSKGEAGVGYMVTGVQAGSRCEEFNAANPAHALKVGDTVVQVCGSQDIINAVKSNDPVVLTIVTS